MITTRAAGYVEIVGERVGSSEHAIMVFEPRTGVTTWLPRRFVAIREGMPVRGPVFAGDLPRIAIEVTAPGWLAREKGFAAAPGAAQGRLGL